MRRWQLPLVVALAVAGLVTHTGKAAAADGEVLASAFSSVLVDIADWIDGVLGQWVSGNSLTDPRGESVANWLIDQIHHWVVYFAQFFEDLTSIIS